MEASDISRVTYELVRLHEDRIRMSHEDERSRWSSEVIRLKAKSRKLATSLNFFHAKFEDLHTAKCKNTESKTEDHTHQQVSSPGAGTRSDTELPVHVGQKPRYSGHTKGASCVASDLSSNLKRSRSMRLESGLQRDQISVKTGEERDRRRSTTVAAVASYPSDTTTDTPAHSATMTSGEARRPFPLPTNVIGAKRQISRQNAMSDSLHETTTAIATAAAAAPPASKSSSSLSRSHTTAATIGIGIGTGVAKSTRPISSYFGQEKENKGEEDEPAWKRPFNRSSTKSTVPQRHTSTPPANANAAAIAASATTAAAAAPAAIGTNQAVAGVGNGNRSSSNISSSSSSSLSHKLAAAAVVPVPVPVLVPAAITRAYTTTYNDNNSKTRDAAAPVAAVSSTAKASSNSLSRSATVGALPSRDRSYNHSSTTTAAGTDTGNSSISRQQRPPLVKCIEVVRNRSEREALPGYTCTECAPYYQALLEQGAITKERFSEVLQNCSRHKSRWTPPSTPEGFWDLSVRTPDDWKQQDKNKEKSC